MATIISEWTQTHKCQSCECVFSYDGKDLERNGRGLCVKCPACDGKYNFSESEISEIPEFWKKYLW